MALVARYVNAGGGRGAARFVHGRQLAACVWVEPEIGLQHSLRGGVHASADLGRVRAEDPDAATLVAAMP
jgi:hypothetical protein